MHDDELTPLEADLARRLSAYGAIDVRPADSLATARRVMTRPRGVGLGAGWAHLRPPVRAAIVLALLAALVLGAVMIGAQLARPTLMALPSASAGPSASAAAPTGEPVTGVVAEADWVADARGIEGTADPLRLRLSTSADGRAVIVEWGTAETERISSAATVGPAGGIDVLTTLEGSACDVGNVGRYQVVASAEVLSLVAVREDCAVRGLFLARPWVRALDATNAGGRGVIDRFLPGDKVLVTLPAGLYLASVSADAASLTDERGDRTLIVIRNPIGLAEPCSSSGGAKLDVESTSAAFSTYLGTLPGLTVNAEAVTIDGRPGSKLTIPTIATGDCPGGRVAEWTPRNAATNTFWFIRQGDTDRLYLVDVDRPCAVGEAAGTGCRDLFLVQWLGSGVTDAEEQAILDTMTFRTDLPSG